MINCITFQQQLDDWLDGQLPVDEQATLQAHLQQCGRCRQQYAEARELQQALRDLPVPAPSPDFARRVIQRATRSHNTAAHGWLKGSIAAGALIIALFAGYLAGNLSGPDQHHGAITVTLAPQQVSTVQLAFHSRQALENVRLTLQLPAQIEIDGYPDRRELSWQTNLAQGSNHLRLPLILRSNDWQGGELIARLEHPSGQREFRIQARVNPAAGSGTTRQTL